jgi:hypothetical protein
VWAVDPLESEEGLRVEAGSEAGVEWGMKADEASSAGGVSE